MAAAFGLPGFLEKWKSDWIDPALDYIDGPRYKSDAHLNGVCIEYREEDIKEATRNFDPKFLLGSGTFGCVYKGTMGDGTEVAIKVLQVPEEAGFEDEVKVLSRFRHPNLVILMGFGRHAATGGRSLIYEYLAGGDVSKRLQRSRQQVESFEWKARLSAALDAACGLSHLHNMSPRAFHRDIKAPNILLDRNGTAKMADFGLSCVSSGSQHKVQQASGTVGYACPEYIRSGIITEFSEVHSYGMVSLEMLTGAPPAVARTDRPHEFHYLVDHLEGSTSKVLEMVDATAHFPKPLSQSLAEFAFRCILPNPFERPLFKQIVEELRNMLNQSEDRTVKGVSRGETALALDCSSSMSPGILDRTSSAAFHRGSFDRADQQPPSQMPEGKGDAGQRVGLRRVTLSIGTPIECRWRGRPGWFCGQILRVNTNGTFAVQYSDGELEDHVSAQFIRLLELPSVQAGSALRQLQLTAAGSVGPESDRPSQRHELERGCVIPQVRVPALVCRLWCIFAEGVDLARLKESDRAMWWPSQSQELVAGRTAQPAAFWNTLVPSSRNQSTVSRQHFRLMNRRANPNEQGGYTLQCMSLNGILHNQRYVSQEEGERPVQHGDTVALAISTEGGSGTRHAFVAFAFEIVRPVPPLVADRPLENWVLGRWINDSAGPLALQEALFCLEVHGEDIDMALPSEHRRLFFCLVLKVAAANALRIGFGCQQAFWQRVGRAESLRHLQAKLAPEHFEIKALRDAVVSASGNEQEWCFKLRALGQAAVHVNRARLPYASESELTHGDLLAVEAPTSEQGAFNHTLFFTFVALAGSGQSAEVLQASNRPRPLPDVRSLWGDDSAEALGLWPTSPSRLHQLAGPAREAGPLKPPQFAGNLDTALSGLPDVDAATSAARVSSVLSGDADEEDDPDDLFSQTGFRATNAIGTDRV